MFAFRVLLSLLELKKIMFAEIIITWQLFCCKNVFHIHHKFVTMYRNFNSDFLEMWFHV